MRRSLRLAGAVLVVALATTGCGIKGLQGYHLPGGASFGHDTYKVTITFHDVTALLPQSSVRVNDVPVGDVDAIDVCTVRVGECVPVESSEAGPYKALVTVSMRQNVSLPANSTGRIEQTSLLGEKYIAIGPPDGRPAVGELPKDGTAQIKEEQTFTQPDVEEVFSALSLLLNGGGVEQLQTINNELAVALTGRETNFRGLLGDLDHLVGSLDHNRFSIVRALESLDRLSRTLVRQKATIATALTDIAPGLRVLADQQPNLTNLLRALAQLGDTATRVIHETKSNTVANLESLDPILTRLAKAGTYLPRALEVILDYPFPKNATKGIFGDYTGLLADIDLNESIKTLTGLSLNLPNTATPGTTTHGTKGKRHGGKGATDKKKLLDDLGLPPLVDKLLKDTTSGVTGDDDTDLLKLLLGGLT